MQDDAEASRRTITITEPCAFRSSFDDKIRRAFRLGFSEWLYLVCLCSEYLVLVEACLCGVALLDNLWFLDAVVFGVTE